MEGRLGLDSPAVMDGRPMAAAEGAELHLLVLTSLYFINTHDCLLFWRLP